MGSLNYINRFFRLKCAVDLVQHKIFPNAKEITESFGCFEAVRKNFPFHPGDPTINIVCVGDGNTPRTAALFAFLTNWNCVSIDPKFKKTDYPIRRLTLLKSKVEDVELAFEKCVIISCHSHASINAVLKSIVAKDRSFINMPCCNQKDKPRKKPLPDIQYYDDMVLSLHNLIKIWKSI